MTGAGAVIVTGAGGRLGSQLARRLLKEGFPVVSMLIYERTMALQNGTMQTQLMPSWVYHIDLRCCL
jgi:nucleoside-diphosphate-sugar epimerase